MTGAHRRERERKRQREGERNEHMGSTSTTVAEDLHLLFHNAIIDEQQTRDRIPTFWIFKERVYEILEFLKNKIDRPFRMLYDLTAIDERVRMQEDLLPKR